MMTSTMRSAFIASLLLAGSFASQGGGLPVLLALTAGLAFAASPAAFKLQPVCSIPPVAHRE